MEKLSNAEKLNNTSVAIGNFDGVHLAHRSLMDMAIKEKGDLKSVAYTFCPHPASFFGKEVTLLQTEEEKEEEIKAAGVDILYIEKCNEEFLKKSPEEFVRDILFEKLSAKKVFVGFDFTFGHNGEGNVDTLIELGKKYGFSVTVLGEVKNEDGEAIKSSTIRKYIKNGDMEKANKMLGYVYSFSGKVTHCKGLGKNLGFPTANIFPDHKKVLPPFGVYAVKVHLEGKTYEGVANIGINPTVEEGNRPKIEVNILDFDKDIYEKSIKVSFVSRIRSEKKFQSIEELASQIKKDVKDAKKCLTNQ